jgi:hypothetical protein
MTAISFASGLPGSGGGTGITGGGSTPPTLELPTAILALSPLGYWKLDETSGTTATDSSGNARDGTYTGTVTLADTSGADGGDYPTFGGGYVTIPDDNVWSANNASGLTVFALVSPTGLTGSARKFIISKGQGSAYEWELTHSNTDSNRVFWITYAPAGTALTNISHAGLTTGFQSYTARTQSPTQAGPTGMYRNGVGLTPTVGSNFAGTYTNNAAPLVIGQRGDLPSGQGFAGAIAHVAVFAGYMDPADVTDINDAASADGWF